MGGLEIDRHDELPLVSTGASAPEEREAAAAYVTRRARDHADRDLLLAALGLAWTAASITALLWGRNAWRAL